MNNNSILELTLRDILHVIYPLDEDWSIRFRIIDEVRSVIQSIESLRGATVEPFGSFVSNLFTRWGDLDISIELSNGLYISSAGKKHKQSLLGEVLKALRKRGGSRKLHFIANARIPILKFETSYNVSCDISINNLSGQMKSKLLYWINQIDGRFRDLVLLVKEWAKAHRINDPKSGSLNSYSLSLLVLFHLQTCVPAVLPPLKEIYPGNISADLIGVRVVAEKHVEETCAVNINRYISDRSRMINRSSLSQMFVSFIEKFCDISSRASRQGICPYTGQWEDISTNMRWLPKTYVVFIEDPFEQPVNTARTVSEKQLQNISEAFQTTYNILSSTSQDRVPPISVLVRPQISRLMTRLHVRNQGSYNTGSQVQHQQYLQSARGVQQQPRNVRTANRPNRNTGINRPVQAHQNHAQQVWRPRPDA